MKTKLSRRSFLRTTALTGTGLLILPSSRLAFGSEANSKLNVAAIGIAGQGGSNLSNVANLGVNIVALCDVDHAYAAAQFRKLPQAKPFNDFRRMFDEMEKQIDAVIVSTPDHTHAVAVAAAIRRGKHVYCEKPLTRTIHESRLLRDLARKHKVVTQLGNQGSASNGLRRSVELVWTGTIGEVREAYIWFGGGNGPMTTPTEKPPVPPTLDWDLWLGPAAFRPFSPLYLPGKWRGWRPFGSGIVGDFGCHTANLMFRALKLDQLWNPPSRQKSGIIRVEAQPSERDKEGYPRSLQAIVNLPARGELLPVKLTVSAARKPSEDLLLGHPQAEWGDLLIGEKGVIYSSNPWNVNFVLLPDERFKDVSLGAPEIFARDANHHREWVDACKGNGQTFSSFEIGAPLTELMQLVNLSTLVEGAVEYDPMEGEILSPKAARPLLHRQYRRGWKI
jgi:predicted dehydrogenase